MTLILVVLLVLILVGGGVSFPRAGAYNADWGFAPFGGIVGLLLILVLLHLLGVF